jgi:hypothetical protein
MQRKHTLESADEYESMPQQETQQDGGPARTAEKPLGVSRRGRRSGHGCRSGSGPRAARVRCE